MSDFKKVVTMHNNFIEAIYSLDITAKKLLLSIILHLTEDNQITITREELIREVGIDLSRSNKVDRELAIRELMTKLITIRSLENCDFEIYQLLKATKYKDGVLRTSVYTDLLPYFVDVRDSLFTRFNIQNIKPLTSIYAIRVYEMCKQFESTGILSINIEELRKRLSVENRYERVYDLKKWVFDVAKKQINTNTDIKIDYKLRKKNSREYTFVDFTIKSTRAQTHSKQLFELELSDTQKELNKYVGSKIEGHIIRGFRVVESDIYVETDIGDYRFLNIETLKQQVKTD